jgi:hypothetical protein
MIVESPGFSHGEYVKGIFNRIMGWRFAEKEYWSL